MSNSKLVTYTKWSPNYDSRQGTRITDITIHHMAGNLSVYQCGEVFQTREASAHYGIDGEGRIGQYVDEKYASWANANAASNRRSVTIELANDQIGGEWHVSDTAINRCIELCVDICKRNGIKKLNYTGDTSGNLTRHNMFYATACPGQYLQSKFPYIANKVNARLNGGWRKEGGYWYFYKNGVKQTGWLKDNNKWYYLGPDGAMYSSAWLDYKGEWYYLKSNGVMASDEWVETKKGWCYLGTDGKMLKAKWIRWKENMYYVKEDGYMAVGDMTLPCKFSKSGKLEA